MHRVNMCHPCDEQDSYSCCCDPGRLCSCVSQVSGRAGLARGVPVVELASLFCACIVADCRVFAARLRVWPTASRTRSGRLAERHNPEGWSEGTRFPFAVQRYACGWSRLACARCVSRPARTVPLLALDSVTSASPTTSCGSIRLRIPCPTTLVLPGLLCGSFQHSGCRAARHRWR